jgi:diacylglycerol O-acyltransferase / wax synthase
MSGSVAMSVSILSYDGRVTVGVMSDAGLVPDPERIVRGFERELRKLRRLYLPEEGAPRLTRTARRSRRRSARRPRAA